MHLDVRIRVRDLEELRAGAEFDAQLLPALARKGLLRRLVGLHLAAHKFPQQAARLVRRALADQKALTPLDQGRDDFYHMGPFFPQKCLS